MKKVGIVGYGYVGKAMARFFANHYDVCVYDPAYSIEAQDDGFSGATFVEKDDINKCDFGIICVPTPKGKTGECLSLIHI